MSRLTNKANEKASRLQPHPFEQARAKVIEKIMDFVRNDNDTSVLELKMPVTDEEAASQGFPSVETQQQAIREIVDNLPVDVAQRVKVVKNRRGRLLASRTKQSSAS